MIFTDTSAFLALVNEKDKDHVAAMQFLEEIKNGKIRVKKIITSDYIIDETLTRIRYCTSFALMKKRGIEKAFSFDGDFEKIGFFLLPMRK